MEDPISAEYLRRIESGIKKLEKDKEVTPRNKEIIFDFLNDAKADGVKDKRIYKLLGLTKNLALWLNNDFDKATEKDIKKLIAENLENGKYKEWTKWTYKRVLKKLYKFLKKPELMEGIKIKPERKERISRNEILSQEDIKSMIKLSRGPRNKAIISLLWECGMRSEELRRMKRKHFVSGESPHVMVPGVKESPKIRQIPIGDSVVYLSKWLENHPIENPEAYLFPCLATKSIGGMITSTTLNKILRYAGEKAKISKPFYSHAIRHAAATYLGNYYSESQMNNHFGWRQGSQMAKFYVHSGPQDLENAFYRMKGVCIKCKSKGSLPKSDYCSGCITNMKNEPRSELTPIKCPVCGEINMATAKICARCSIGLDPKTRLNHENRQQEYVNVRKDLEITNKKLDNVMSILNKFMAKEYPEKYKAEMENSRSLIKQTE